MITLGIGEIRRRHLDTNYRERGVDWFDRGATRFFRSRYPQWGFKAGPRAFFITSEQFMPGAQRCYNIRVMDWATGRIDTLGEFQEWLSRARACRRMMKIIQRYERLCLRSTSGAEQNGKEMIR